MDTTPVVPSTKPLPKCLKNHEHNWQKAGYYKLKNKEKVYFLTCSFCLRVIDKFTLDNTPKIEVSKL